MHDHIHDTADLIISGQRINEDGNGFINLTDIWKLAGSPSTKRPANWRQLPTTEAYIEAVAQNVGFSYIKEKNDIKSVIYVKKGKGGGTYAHILIAIAYAEYLSPALAVDVKQTYLRYRSGDLTLVDEILEKAEAAKKFQDTRDISKQIRNRYSSVLVAHGAGRAIGYCTDAIYKVLLGGTTKQIAQSRNLPAKTSLRDNLPTGELLQTMTTEHLASDRIEEKKVLGREPCAQASRRAAHFVKEAFEREKADRAD